MVSAYCARPFGFGINLLTSELEAINRLRKKTTYISKDSALNVYGSNKKKPFHDHHQLVRYFDVGINDEGYWNYDHMCLQNEDCFDILRVVFPKYDYVLLMDQSSGHGKRAGDSLHAPSMSVKYGGLQPKMHPTVVQEVGPYHPQLTVGDTQSMVFLRGDKGPFNLHPKVSTPS